MCRKFYLAIFLIFATSRGVLLALLRQTSGASGLTGVVYVQGKHLTHFISSPMYFSYFLEIKLRTHTIKSTLLAMTSYLLEICVQVYVYSVEINSRYPE